jgi:hypothetical protein
MLRPGMIVANSAICAGQARFGCGFGGRDRHRSLPAGTNSARHRSILKEVEMKTSLVALVVLAALPLLAADVEQFLLPVSPSVVHCGYESRYETRLVAFNDSRETPDLLCATGDCAAVQPLATVEFAGGYAGGTPLPAFVYLPKESARRMRMSLVVESSERSRLDERSYTELPIVSAREFTTGKMQFVGVRVDEGFRQTVRMYGLDGERGGQVMMRVYPMDSGMLLHECVHEISSITHEKTAEGYDLRPAFGMECDMSEHIPARNQKVRIELEPITKGLQYWAFISITNNKTQHFYTVLGR